MAREATIHRLPESNRPLPFDVAAERAVVATGLLEAKWLDEALALLSEEHFYLEQHRLIFRAMTEIRALGVAADVVSVRRWLDKHGHLKAVTPAYLSEILALDATTVRVADYARSIFDCWRLRQLHAACSETAADIRNGKTPENVQEYLDGVAARFAETSRCPEVSGAKSIGESVREAFEHMRERLAAGRRILGSSTGFVRLDEAIDGLQTGRVVVVAGRPGMGKTSFSQAIALNVARGGGAVGYFSLEMTAKELGMRALCSSASVDPKSFGDGAVSRDDWARMASAANELAKLPLVIDDSAVSFPQLRAKVTQLQAQFERKRQGRMRLVIIDHLGLFNAEKQYKTKREQIEANTKRIKDMAKDLDICVIVLSQLNRAVESRAVKDKTPQLSDLRDSGSIEQDADIVLMLCRDDYYEKDRANHTNLMKCIVAKNRAGETGFVWLRFDAKFGRFDNLELGEEP